MKLCDIINLKSINTFYGVVDSPVLRKKMSNGKTFMRFRIRVKANNSTRLIFCKSFDNIPRLTKGSKRYFKGEWDSWNNLDFFTVNYADVLPPTDCL